MFTVFFKRTRRLKSGLGPTAVFNYFFRRPAKNPKRSLIQKKFESGKKIVITIRKEKNIEVKANRRKRKKKYHHVLFARYQSRFFFSFLSKAIKRKIPSRDCF